MKSYKDILDLFAMKHKNKKTNNNQTTLLLTSDGMMPTGLFNLRKNRNGYRRHWF